MTGLKDSQNAKRGSRLDAITGDFGVRLGLASTHHPWEFDPVHKWKIHRYYQF